MTKISSKERSTRNQLLKSAQIEFAKKGFAGARIDVIARNAKLNKAMLYYYFGTKEKLYVEVLRSLFCNNRNFDMDLEQLCHSLSPDIKFYSLIYFLVKSHLEVKDQTFNQILAWELAEGSPYFHLIVEDLLLPVTQKLEKIIVQGNAQGIFFVSDVPLFVLNVFFMIASFSNTRELLRNSGFEKNIFVKNYQQRFLDFIMVDILPSMTVEKESALALFSSSPEFAVIQEKIDHLITKIKNEKD